MELCPSGLLLSALVLLIILNDIFSNRIYYVLEHFFLGTITCALFFTLCNYGLEQINWIFLALIPIIIFIKWIYTPSMSDDDDDDECEICQAPKKTCGCPVKKIECPVKKIECHKSKELNCPGNPVVLPTACGITRYF
jgi:cadmium resistance protein CadD (predicted permease)